jgi:hypothetical protein
VPPTRTYATGPLSRFVEQPSQLIPADPYPPPTLTKKPCRTFDVPSLVAAVLVDVDDMD